MLRSRLTGEMVQFIPRAKNWEEAIRMASEPLLKHGYIEAGYVDAMISNVKELGPYIVLMPRVAMPHARPEDGVRKMGISLLITEDAVLFEGGKSANAFFVVAAEDATSHLTLLQEISDLLSDEEKITKLLGAGTYEDLLNLL
ncbi:PTS sugar transporter subunit IIA [Peribacillus kribbensis]|uniref:PTS sugar transporter subunit IIA n=1 Tax=Peribacillus kribbensis TaxID=356658 RepID=UPI000425BE7C|nr:PTS sugar transporter subunit IIA [Peribacillus kribbensis]